MPDLFCAPLTFTPVTKNYVWGGQQLKALITQDTTDPHEPLAEVWTIYEENIIVNGPFTGKSLQEVTTGFSKQILGETVARRSGARFPLLIKLLDCADWLSVQVHPNDEQALALEGPGHLGKTEAWHVLSADPGARLIAGVRSGISNQILQDSIRNGTVSDVARWHAVQTGDTILINAGTLHALGPGLLIYEVQQTSDLTYRVYDWDRPATAGRDLHIDKSVAVTNSENSAELIRLAQLPGGEFKHLTQSPFFELDLLESASGTILLNTAALSFHALTIIEGKATLRANKQEISLGKFQSVLVPAVCGSYTLSGAFRVLKASVPG